MYTVHCTVRRGGGGSPSIHSFTFFKKKDRFNMLVFGSFLDHLWIVFGPVMNHFRVVLVVVIKVWHSLRTFSLLCQILYVKENVWKKRPIKEPTEGTSHYFVLDIITNCWRIRFESFSCSSCTKKTDKYWISLRGRYNLQYKKNKWLIQRLIFDFKQDNEKNGLNLRSAVKKNPFCCIELIYSCR